MANIGALASDDSFASSKVLPVIALSEMIRENIVLRRSCKRSGIVVRLVSSSRQSASSVISISDNLVRLHDSDMLRLNSFSLARAGIKRPGSVTLSIVCAINRERGPREAVSGLDLISRILLADCDLVLHPNFVFEACITS